MKRIIILFMIIVLILTACNETRRLNPTQYGLDTTVTLPATTAENTKTMSTNDANETTGKIIVHHTLPNADKIVLDTWIPEEDFYSPTYRACYYNINGRILNLVDGKLTIKFFEEWDRANPSKEEANEMYVKAFVEYFDIPKEKFEEEVQKEIAFRLERGEDISRESHEIPNPDIIYTFDDAIINDYYRRDKGVKPTETQSSVTE